MTRLCVTLLLITLTTSPVLGARTLVRNICRVKGQHEVSVRGLGLVVGLAGTGDSGDFRPMAKLLARAMELMGSPLSRPDLQGKGGLLELRDTKNVAVVWVTATIPAAGASRGDRIDCYVSAINAKSLKGGRLTFAALLGPVVGDHRVYGLAEGRVELDDPQHLTEGKIFGGCRLLEDFDHGFYEKESGIVTLILDKDHADFVVAGLVAESINRDGDEIAEAVNAATIQVKMPDYYRENPVEFVRELMEQWITEPEPEARVVINQRSGNIVISGNVEIGAVIVRQNGVVVEAGRGEAFAPFDPDAAASNGGAKLESLVTALNALQVSPQDMIEVIKGIDRLGALHAPLIIE